MNKKIVMICIIAVIVVVISLLYKNYAMRRKIIVNNNSKEESIALKVDSSTYERYIIVGGSNKNYINSKIEEYLLMLDIEGEVSDYFKIEKYKKAYRVEVLDNVDFYLYHNLIGWISGLPTDNNVPKYTVGMANNNELFESSYFCFVEDVNIGDTLIGKMEYGGTMFIYLPDASNDCINIIEGEYHIFLMDKYTTLMERDGVLE